MTRFGLNVRLAAAGAMALALAACDDHSGRVDAPEPASLADLSAMDALPYAEPARVEYQAPAQGYAWAERAYGLQRAVYDTPPDYGFDYGGVEPLAWETEDDWVMYAEPWDDGYRYYYYEPGAAYPYFVRDGDYGYGYGAGGVLVAVFDAGGRYLPADVVYRVAPMAGRYYLRGHDLRSAGDRARRIRVTEEVWARRAPRVIRTADPWLRAARNDRDWRAWRGRDQDRELRRFEPEAERRAVRARQWREHSGRRAVVALRAQDHGRPHDAEVRQPERRRFEADRREQARQAAQERRQVARAERQRQQQVRDQRPERELRMVRDDRQRQVGRRQFEQRQRRPAEQQQGGQQAQRQPPQRQQQAQARSAEQQGRPAAGRERGPGAGRGHDKKD